MGDDLGLAFADINGVDPFTAKIGVDLPAQFGVDADVNINGTVPLADGPIMGIVGQVDDTPGFEGGFDHHVQFGQDRQYAAAALVSGGDDVFDQFVLLHRSDRFQLWSKTSPRLELFWPL